MPALNRTRTEWRDRQGSSPEFCNGHPLPTLPGEGTPTSPPWCRCSDKPPPRPPWTPPRGEQSSQNRPKGDTKPKGCLREACSQGLRVKMKMCHLASPGRFHSWNSPSPCTFMKPVIPRNRVHFIPKKTFTNFFFFLEKSFLFKYKHEVDSSSLYCSKQHTLVSNHPELSSVHTMVLTQGHWPGSREHLWEALPVWTDRCGFQAEWTAFQPLLCRRQRYGSALPLNQHEFTGAAGLARD